MRCPVHLSIGEEATAAGVCVNLTENDLVFGNHRSHSHYLAKGGDLKKFFAELYGKVTGCAKGIGGSMHLIDVSAGFMGATPIVASTIPISVGAAFSLSMQKSNNNIVVSFFGDAAVEEGAFHEALNFAKLKNLPVLFLCENNLYSVYTPLHLRQPNRKIADVVSASGVNSYEIDGNDAIAVYETSKKAIDGIREGNGPAFIEASTYRWREHCGVDYDNQLGYRSENEFLKWKKRDPINLLKEEMLKKNEISESEISAIENKLKIKIEEAVNFAKSSKFPDKNELGKYLYAD